ncbi:MAG: efflux RND transporter periplasmic adaptor subunit [Candidatus Omnitrophica bacterium]|nr:efflux RND transporter periplasmic adaptor subunit [Candidatus Omnitrophota bacterium]
MTLLDRPVNLIRSTSFTACLVLIGLAIGATPSLSQGGPRVTAVHVSPAKMVDLQESQKLTGSLRAVSRAGVAALEAGQVLEVMVQEGDKVSKGEILAKLDDRRLKAQIEEKEASLAVAQATVLQHQAELARAKQDFARSQKLWKDSVVTDQDFDHAQADVAVAEAMVNAAEKGIHQIESEIDLLRVRFEDLTIKAPFDGQVVERQAEPGEWIEQGKGVATIVSTGTIEAWIEVPERYVNTPALKDRKVEIEIHATGDRLSATDVEMVPDVHSRTRTFMLVAKLNDPSGSLTPGMSVSAWLPVGEQGEHLTVFKDAIVRDAANSYVYKTTPTDDGGYQAVQVPVEVLFQTGDLVAVRSADVQDGDQVVIEGNERLMPGMPVNPIEKKAPSLAKAEPVIP